ncbi:dihydrofolate reductase [Arcanobacterium wilhelmae]|uniref:dihydrofolate reductase n=1 Tax=Arcanobacterium wilhelmae TaxID=1803177 RepID=A0ABT9N9N9_9ACTO|nr:dihydrofolate reductase [Arcanobacterium wilhelmae]MDP9800414.1 dihydrofolate reductase [Arcanobacterium wilhelmae]
MLGAIWAQGHGRAIGAGGTLPWHLPEDLALFKRATLGCDVIMGRRTWESIPQRNRPLPRRRNIVVTSADAGAGLFDGAEVVRSVEAAVAASRTDIVWCIGGAGLFEALTPRADLLLVTDVDVDVPDADTFAPTWDLAAFDVAQAAPARGWLTSRTGLRYRTTLYARRGVRAPEIELG